VRSFDLGSRRVGTPNKVSALSHDAIIKAADNASDGDLTAYAPGSIGNSVNPFGGTNRVFRQDGEAKLRRI
jgi:hypothetical protein